MPSPADATLDVVVEKEWRRVKVVERSEVM
jgi:hypothetical protein